MTIGKKIVALRKALDWTQERLASQIQATPPWGRPRLAVVENDRNKLTSVAAREAIASGFGVPVAMLMGYLEDRIPLDAIVKAIRTPSPPSSPPDLTVERNERYPNRAEAIRAVGKDFAPEAVRYVASLSLHAANDPSVREWVQELEDAERRFRRGTLTPSPEDLAKSKTTAAEILENWPDAFGDEKPPAVPATEEPTRPGKRKGRG